MMKNLPKSIFLQVDPDGEMPENFYMIRGVSWCQERINKTDVEYRLPDPEEVPQPVLGKAVFEFSSFQDWLDRGSECYLPYREVHGRDHGIVLLDSQGHLLLCGSDIRTANEKGFAPFRAFELKRP